MEKVKVFKKEIQSEVPMTWIAESVEQIAKAMTEIRNTRASDRLIVALIHDKTKIQKSIIEEILETLGALEKIYKRGCNSY